MDWVNSVATKSSGPDTNSRQMSLFDKASCGLVTDQNTPPHKLVNVYLLLFDN